MNRHMELGLIQAWDVKGFFALDETVRKSLGDVNDPYYLAFVRGLTELADYVHGDDRIALVCDDDESTAWQCYEHYRGVKRALPDIRKKAVSLAFANSHTFPALQAADMIAYLARMEAKSRFYGDRYDLRELFEYITAKQDPGKMMWKEMFANEKTIRGFR
jgi:hypothetical protein